MRKPWLRLTRCGWTLRFDEWQLSLIRLIPTIENSRIVSVGQIMKIFGETDVYDARYD